MILFSIFFLKWYIATAMVALYTYGTFMYIKHQQKNNDTIEITGRQLLIQLVILGIWVFVSGINGITPQGPDFYVRNPIYNDLISKTWPLQYDLQLQSEDVQAIVGTDKVMFNYYLQFWLIPAGICKILGISNTTIAGQILFAWAYIGIILIYLLMLDHFKRFSKWIIATLILFDVFKIFQDIVNILGINLTDLKMFEDMVYMTKLTIDSTTTLLFNSFNSFIPIFIIVELVIVQKDRYTSIGETAWIGSLVFPYGPFYIFGFVPVYIANTIAELYKQSKTSLEFKKEYQEKQNTDNNIQNNSKELCNVPNNRDIEVIPTYKKLLNIFKTLKNQSSIVDILIPIWHMLIYGFMFTQGEGNTLVKGWTVQFFSSIWTGICAILLTELIYFGIYLIILKIG